METGELQTTPMPDENGEPVMVPTERAKSAPVDCKKPGSKCPKISPEHEWKFQLNAANQKLLSMVRRSSAPGFQLPSHLVGCKLWQENYALVKELEQQRDHADLVRAVSLGSLRF